MNKDKGHLPSKRAEAIAARADEIANQKEQAEAAIRGAVARLADTEDGKIFLRWMMKECGYGNSYVAVDNTGKPNAELTMYQAFRLNLWWKVRKLLSVKQIIEVEHE